MIAGTEWGVCRTIDAAHLPGLSSLRPQLAMGRKSPCGPVVCIQKLEERLARASYEAKTLMPQFSGATGGFFETYQISIRHATIAPL